MADFGYSVCGSSIEIIRCTGSAAEVKIPSEIDGLPVMSIGEAAFFWCSNLVSVAFSNSVTHIECCAFYGCTCLDSITIPASVTSIEEDVFWGYCGLPTIYGKAGSEALRYAEKNEIPFCEIDQHTENGNRKEEADTAECILIDPK